MGEKRPYKPRKSGGGRKKLNPEYDAGNNLKEQMEGAVALYEEDCSLQDPYLSEFMGHSNFADTDYYLTLAEPFYSEFESRMYSVNASILPEVPHED